jgi:hypothetical protein
MSYEKPSVQYIGSAEHIVQGVSFVVGDLCNQNNYDPDEFAQD